MAAHLKAFFARHPYVIYGVLFSLFALTLPLLTWQVHVLPKQITFQWKVVSGLVLLLLTGYQWMLLISRVRQNAVQTRKHYRFHRWVGVGSLLLFAAHVGYFGYLWTSALAIIYLACAMTGLLNRELIRFKSDRSYQIWFFIHSVLAALMAPIVVAHIWIALAY